MDKAIEIKRRAQRCILNGDLDGALSEYQKLVSAPDADPYPSVLLADLLYKRGDQDEAAERYLVAVEGYETASLFKNAIAVCKKMSRLSLSPTRVLHKLAELHKFEGLTTEASLYFMQHAELMVRAERFDEAIDSLRHGFDTSTDNVKALERLAEVQLLANRPQDAAKTLNEAADRYNRQGQFADAVRCQDRAQGVGSETESSSEPDVEHGSSLIPDTGMSSEPVESKSQESGPLDPNDQTAAIDGTVEPAAETPTDAAPADDASQAPPGVPLASGITLGSSPEAPGLRFDAPGGESPGMGETQRIPSIGESQESPAAPPEAVADGATDDATHEDANAADPRGDAAAAADPLDRGEASSMADISKLLNDAQSHYAHGERDAAGATLVTAARAYDALGHHDSAASIYKGLHDARQASTQVMVMWLQNCKVRGNLAEASQVACEIGEQSMTDGDVSAAREWFERAQDYNQNNEVAAARLQRLDAASASSVATAEASEVDEAEASAASETADDDALASSAAMHGARAVETDDVVGMNAAAAAPAETDHTETKESGGAADAEGANDAAENARAETPGAHQGSAASALEQGPDTQLDDGASPDLGWLISQFQRGVAEQLANDCRAHYDLGVSYREMGLLNEAIESFRQAGRDSALVPVATEMIVRCMLDQGRLEDAVAELRTVLAEGSLETAAEVSLYYQMGLALEAGGRQEEALEAFECVSAKAADYARVGRKVRDLRVALGRS